MNEPSIQFLSYLVRVLRDGPRGIWLHETLMFLSFWSPQRAGMSQRREEGERKPWSHNVALLWFPLLALPLSSRGSYWSVSRCADGWAAGLALQLG